MKKKTKPGAIQQLLSYAGNNKKQLYLSTFSCNAGRTIRDGPLYYSVIISRGTI